MSVVRSFFLLISLLIFCESSNAQSVRYFRNEKNFLSNSEILINELGFRSFIKVEYDSLDRIISKSFYKRKNKLNNFESYEYNNLSLDIKKKSIFNSDSTLQSFTKFGIREIISEKFIRYAYNITQVKDYDDRFTSIEYDNLNNPILYKFFDVNGYLYGIIEKKYNKSSNKLRQEDWFLMPSKKLIRRYVNQFDELSGETDVWEYDSTLNVVNKMIVDIDGRADIIDLIYPLDNYPVSNAIFSFSLKEDAADIKIKWEESLDNNISNFSYFTELEPNFRKKGKYSKILIPNGPQLEVGKKYKISINGEGESGYKFKEIVINNVFYDTIPPKYNFDVPEFLNSPRASYQLDENLSSAELIWVWEYGQKDSLSPHIIGLSDGILKSGKRDTIFLNEDITLQDGTVYSVLFQGKDLADNEGDFLSLRGILYDISKPIVDLQFPNTNSFINSNIVSYKLNEDLSFAIIEWIQRDGIPDDQSPHIINLEGSELLSGEHLFQFLENSTNLNDGSIYDLKFYGIDKSGNHSDTTIVENIKYDNTPPTLLALSPESGSAISSGQIGYRLGEDFSSGEINWSIQGSDSKNPKNFTLSIDSTGLLFGDHLLHDSTYFKLLNDGEFYQIKFSGRDKSGNEANPSFINNVKFDISPPKFLDVSPKEDDFILSPHISYNLSEQLTEGAIIWTQTSGKFDSNSPHVMNLREVDLSVGFHDSVIIKNPPELIDRSIYDISYMGIDDAGNRSQINVQKNVMYDIYNPEIKFNFPISGSHMSSKEINYSLSEDMSSIVMELIWKNGKIDVNAPYYITFMEDELDEGNHKLELKNMPDLVSGAIYDINIDGSDLSGKKSNIINFSRITYDSDPPEIFVDSPQDNSFINTSAFGYQLSEDLLNGIITWKSKKDNVDSSSPHVVQLEDKELLNGFHKDIILTNYPFLKDSVVYDVSFYGADSAGNLSDTVRIKDITYDISKPIININSPLTNDYINDYFLSYDISENISKGEVLWERTGGENDLNFIHNQVMNSAELEEKEIFLKALSDSISLVNGSIYSLSILATDFAGNTSRSKIIKNLKYDSIKPSIIADGIKNNDFINKMGFNYILSENVMTGTIIWESNNDDSLLINILSEDELNEGSVFIDEFNDKINLVDGVSYNISMFVVDSANNLSDTLFLNNITYDDSQPTISLINPISNSNVKSSNISYELSETMSNIEIFWERIGGSRDGISEHSISLVDDELIMGSFEDKVLINKPQLQEGAIYNLKIFGFDLAGNMSNEIFVENLNFDATPPIFEDFLPQPKSYVNTNSIGYWLSEDLKDGLITWTRIGGNNDSESPHLSKFLKWDLNLGSREYAPMLSGPNLVDGAIYAITVEGTDLAGNKSDPFIIDSITYDLTKPIVDIMNPEDDGYINNPSIIFNNFEDLKELNVQYINISGKEDKNSPHLISLSNDYLSKGYQEVTIPSFLPILNDGSFYNISLIATDLAGNKSDEIMLSNIFYDITKPIIANIFPINGQYINSSNISFNTNEKLQKIDYNWLSSDNKSIISTKDSIGVGEQTLIASENDKLVDGEIYSLIIQGMDRSGNLSDTLLVNNIRFDTSKPEFLINYPKNNQYVSSTDLEYNISEDLLSGEIIWESVNSNNDLNSPHIIKLINGELLKDGLNGNLNIIPSLLDNTYYNVLFKGVDLALNESTPIEITNVLTDFTKPVITINSPKSNSSINSGNINYFLSEDLNKGNVIWYPTGTDINASTSQIMSLDAEELNSGDHTQDKMIFPPILENDKRYDIAFYGKDFADNFSDTLYVNNVLFDTIIPVISLDFPYSNNNVNDFTLSYSLSEPLLEGKIILNRVSGNEDLNSPHIAELTQERLNKLDNFDISFFDESKLNNGSTYDILFNGIDYAGNKSDTSRIANVTFDSQPPVISIIEPNSNQYIDKISMSYNFSEDLLSSTIKWTNVSDPSVFYTYTLLNQDLTAGNHNNIDLSDSLLLQDGNIYNVEFSGTDLAGNEAQIQLIENVGYDVFPPVLSISSPQDSSFINQPFINFSISENLDSATITWINQKNNSFTKIELIGNNLKKGDYLEFIDPNMTPLTSGDVYTLQIEGKDLAGNKSDLFLLNDITFDNISPIVSIDFPISNKYINKLLFTYELDETLDNASIQIDQIDGLNDPFAPYKIDFVENELDNKTYEFISLSNSVDLKNGSVYTLKFQGNDRAGNKSNEIIIDRLSFDNLSPTIEINFPTSNSSINDIDINYSISEDLDSMIIEFERIDGNEDFDSPHIIYLSNGDLLKGENKSILNSNKPLLNDGSIYNIKISGVDLANNSSEEILIENIVFDVTPPNVISYFPIPSSIINSASISYSLSEKLDQGKLIWTQVGGEDDLSSPHEIILSQSEMTIGDHDSVEFSEKLNLLNGSIYNIVFQGNDEAGNSISGMTIEGLTFDNGPPILSINLDNNYKAFNSSSISYSTSEDLLSGKIIFENIGGENDINSPHEIVLTGKQLSSGDHTLENFNNSLNLNNDSFYNIIFSGEDVAGNKAELVKLENMRFDNILPIADISIPLPSSIINNHEVSYTISENLIDGYAIWTQVSGNEDMLSPRRIKMKPNEMEEGERSTIFAEPEPLISGAIYNLTLELIDEAGNVSLESIVNDLRFDLEPPQFSDIIPSGGYYNSKEINFFLNENIQFGTISFQETNNSSSRQDYELINDDLIAGKKIKTLEEMNINLLSGSEYKIIFQATDIAGNQSEFIESEVFIFDIEKPSLIVSFPEQNTSINEPKISFETSEQFKNLNAIWTSSNGQVIEQSFPAENLNGSFENIIISNSPSLIDGGIYSLTFSGTDLSDNPLEFESINDILFDITPPKIKVKLTGPSQGLFIHNSPIEISLNENMSEVKFIWEREGGSDDENSPHTLFLDNSDLLSGEKTNINIPGLENVLIGTSYTLYVNGKDLAGNESSTQKLENIDIVKELNGDWIYQGIAVIAWSFTNDKKFNQGVLFGNTLSDQKPGTYAIDWGKRPFRLAIKYDDGTRRFGLFEFIGHNKLRVVSSSEKRPSSWSDGDYFEFNYKENAVP